MERSESINELAQALSKAQGEIKTATKDSRNPHFNSSYADLASVWDACRNPLAKNGLSIIQSPSKTAGGISITTLLMHTSGQWVQDSIELSPRDPGPQAAGSCITYGRRYSLMAFVGIAPDDDDDGNAASRPQETPRRAQNAPVAPKAQEPKQKAPESKPEAPPVSKQTPQPSGAPGAAELQILNQKARERGWTGDQVCSYMKNRFSLIEAKVSALSMDQFHELLNTISAKTHAEAAQDLAINFNDDLLGRIK